MSHSASTSKDVAKLACVSQSTVSLVFSGKTKGRVSEETVRRVIAAAETLEYQPNGSAQMLRNGSSRNIAFVVPDLQQPYFGELVYSAELEAAKSGHAVILLDSIASDSWCDRVIALFRSKIISGCIIYACPKPLSDRLKEFSALVVYIEPDDTEIQDIVLCVDSVADTLRDYILGSKKNRIAFLRSSLERKHFKRRHSLFEMKLSSLRRSGKSFFSEYSSFSVDDATLHALRLLEMKPDIVLCDDDLLAGAVYRAASMLRVSIPSDVAVIGFNDTILCKFLCPELSTIHIPANLIGSLAIMKIRDRIRGSKRVLTQVELNYVEREST